MNENKKDFLNLFFATACTDIPAFHIITGSLSNDDGDAEDNAW